MSDSLGIYFGSKVINIVETKGKKVLNNIQILRSSISTAGLEERVPEEVKIVALFKDELRRNKIEARDVGIALSGKDLIIRTFEIPTLPSNELLGAVNFEAKKYIPFRVEELVSDFQVEYDKKSHRNLVLFAGVKKETLDKYTSILQQLDLKVHTIEYSPFSVLRLLRMAGIGNRGVIGVISTDFQVEGEVNFTVLQNGFPLFSRDISLLGDIEEVPKGGTAEPGAASEKLKTEIRISLDYYHRKFPAKKLEKAFLISEEEQRVTLETFMKELGVATYYVDAKKIIGHVAGFSLSFVKGYSCSLYKTVRVPLKIDLFAIKTKVQPARDTLALQAEVSLFAGLRLNQRILILAVILFVAVFSYGLYRQYPIKKELKSIIDARPAVVTVNPESSYEELNNINVHYKNKMQAISQLINKDVYFTEILNAIPRVIPKNLWLGVLSFNKKAKNVDFTLQGHAYLGDSPKEIELVNTFAANLKSNPIIAKYFNNVQVVSIDQLVVGDKVITNFFIMCRGYPGERE